MINFDNKFDSDLSEKFKTSGEVVFVLSKYKAALLKNITQTEIKLWKLRSKGKRYVYATYGRLLMLSLAVKSTLISILFDDVIKIFDFYLINKYSIKNIHQELIDKKYVKITYFYRQSKL